MFGRDHVVRSIARGLVLVAFITVVVFLALHMFRDGPLDAAYAILFGIGMVAYLSWRQRS
ncbi:MAG: hypothetical protein JHC95_19945 [Solirubrobacteraceae bacterium]|nr:hypothetical protein [Solirubrobacteraceae bacterium]